MDIVIQIIFLTISALIIGSAMMVVTVRNIIHAALWLITTFLGIGMLYLLLQAEFLAMVQVLIYVGAVSVLVLFAVMLTRHITDPEAPLLQRRWIWACIVSVSLFALILVPTLTTQQWNQAIALPGVPQNITGPVEIGVAFMREFLLPFQIAAVLLLVALVGAIVIAYEVRDQRRVMTLAEEVALRREQQMLTDGVETKASGNAIERAEAAPDTVASAAEAESDQAETTGEKSS